MTDGELIQISLSVVQRMGQLNRQPNAEKWCRGWAAVSERMDTKAIAPACWRAIRTKSNDKQDATTVLVAVRRSADIARRMKVIEEFLDDAYPQDKASARLETELGMEVVKGELLGKTLDRACMKARAQAAPDAVLVENECKNIRRSYEILDRLV